MATLIKTILQCSTAELFKYVWSFYNIMHERVKYNLYIWLLTYGSWQQAWILVPDIPVDECTFCITFSFTAESYTETTHPQGCPTVIFRLEQYHKSLYITAKGREATLQIIKNYSFTGHFMRFAVQIIFSYSFFLYYLP